MRTRVRYCACTNEVDGLLGVGTGISKVLGELGIREEYMFSGIWEGGVRRYTIVFTEPVHCSVIPTDLKSV